MATRRGVRWLIVSVGLALVVLFAAGASAAGPPAAEEARVGPPPASRVATARSAPGVPLHAVNGHVATGPQATIVGSDAVLVVVPEHGVDLNGDGDGEDDVVHLFDRVNGPLNLGLAVNPGDPVVAFGDEFAFLVPEWRPGGSDLNGDGDTDDWVLHVASVGAGVTNLGLAAWDFVPTQAGLAIAVREGAQGGKDLNGDGDAGDAVVQEYDAVTGLITNSGLAVGDFLMIGPRMYDTPAGLALAVSEFSQGFTDLNGDGDQSDEVLHLADGSGGFTNLGFQLAHNPTGVVGVGDDIAFATEYPARVHVYDPATATDTDLGLASSSVYSSGELLAFPVSEMEHGADLNGDGDDMDAVAHVWHRASGTVNLGMVAMSFEAIDGGFAFQVPEASQGATDLNGDGDAADQVFHLYRAGTTTNLQLAGWTAAGADGYVALLAAETEQGTDLNGDGDAHDEVVHVWRPATGLANIGLAAIRPPPPDGDSLVTFGARTAWITPEWAQGEIDIDGNGSVSDYLVYVYEPALGADYLHTNGSGRLAAAGDLLAFGVDEVAVDADLNRDGDREDSYVLHVAAPDLYPVANDDDYVVPRGGTIADQAPGLLANDRHPQDEPFVGGWYTDPSHGTVDVFIDGSFVYTHDGSAATTDTFAYWLEVAGGAASNQAVVLITVNEPPATTADGPYVVRVGGWLSDWAPGLLRNDTDADGDELTVHSYEAAGHGTVVVYVGGGFDYVHDGSGGPSDSFSYWATDGWWLSEETMVTIIVEQPPAAIDDAVEVLQGGTVEGNVLVNDTDANGDPLTAVIAVEPTRGSLTLHGDGAFTYTHDGSATAADSFTYRADDGALQSNVATVAITVKPRAGVLPATLGPSSVGLVDPSEGKWYLRDYDSGVITEFFYGNPGDVPFLGDWDCDGIDTPGLFRTSDAYAYLRNSNTVGVADTRFFFGDPADVPLAGDFDGDGCDTLSIYRPGEQRFYVINELGADEGGLGAAEYFFTFGDPGDKPVVGDWDGDGIDEVGLHRESTGFFYYRDTLDMGVASSEFYFGDPGDRFVAGDWGTVDGVDSPAVFRPADTTFYFRHSNSPGVADSEMTWGEEPWLPVSGHLG